MPTQRMKFSSSGDSIKTMVASLKETAGPPHVAVGELETLLATAFAETQVATHVISGSLKASGKTDSEFDGEEWSGEISYGGTLWRTPVPGPAKEVEYALYERARGAEHDFMAPIDTVFTDETVKEIINGHFPG